MNQYEERQMDVNVIVLQFCSLSMFRGTVKVQSRYQVTKILLNEDIPDIHEFKQRLIHSGLSTMVISNTSQSISSTVIDELEDGVTVTTIKELCENSEGGSFWICGTVVNIDKERGWFYLSCKKCYRQVEKVEKQFYCKYCNSFNESAEMKYKLIINIVDDSGSSPIILWDKEIKQVIGKSAAEVNVEGAEEFVVPKEIQDVLLQEKFMFKIKVPFGEGWAFNRAYNVLCDSIN
ncbi:uncharacterized protein LOC131015282 isoform X2 [Salvia miltiorrhiza]|nr:uncharacterized protein LOC131015281 isoform X2 [Salvia miltiorrhiza]XP_057799612.1 uncharacterized protein LOC131015282 isoform X2 [Salvia miltiorrhiza]